MSDKVSSTVRLLKNKSEKGDFLASYQLAQSEKEKVDINNKEKIEYGLRCSQQINSDNLRLEKLKLTNYRGSNHLNLTFSKNKNITVLVGNNGCGKSAVLEAIKKSFSHLIPRLTRKSSNGDVIEETEISNSEDFAKINVDYLLDDKPFKMELASSRELSKKIKGDYTGINQIGSIYELVNSQNKQTSYPLLCFYTVDRALDVTTKDIEKSEEILDEQIWNKAKGYHKALNGKADFKLFFRWFKELVEIENSTEKELVELKADIKSREEQLNSQEFLKLLESIPDSQNKDNVFNSLQNAIDIRKKKLEKKLSTDNRVIDNVRNAIYTFLPGFSNLTIQRDPLDMVIDKNGETLKVTQLSQGEKSMLSLVADISRRLCLLNPAKHDPLDAKGIVLIDEVDLHLHPKAQELYIGALSNTFPNIQFIITSHSPFVVRGLPKLSQVISLPSSDVFDKTFYAMDIDSITNIIFEYDGGFSNEVMLLLSEFKTRLINEDNNIPRLREIYLELSQTSAAKEKLVLDMSAFAGEELICKIKGD